MSQGAFQRWAPLAGPIFVALVVIGFAVSGSSPDSSDSNAKIASYLADDHVTQNGIGFILLLVATLFLIVFFSALRSRLVEIEGPPGRLGTLAFGAGIASTVFLVTAICLFISPIFAADDAPRNILDPGVYRVTQDAGYLIWAMSVVVGALPVWATAAVVLQTGMLPRWFGWASVVVGIICLFAIFFVPIFVFWLWIVVAGLLLALRPVPAARPLADRATAPVT